MPADAQPVWLRASTVDELADFAAMEQDKETSPHILPYTIAQHRKEFCKTDIRYLTILSGDSIQSQGFMILLLEGGTVGLKRIVVAQKGRGYGRAALYALEAWVLAGGHGSRIWLDVFADNSRARHLYEAVGYRPVVESDFFGRSLFIYEKSVSGFTPPPNR